MKIMLVLYALFFCVLMLTSYHPKYNKYYIYTKSFMSFLFVLMAYFTMKNDMNCTWMIAFVCCFFGDVFLGLDEKKEKIYFLLGVSSFLVGHIFFIITIHSYVPIEFMDMIFPLIMCGLTFLLISSPYFDVKGHQKELLVYSIIVSLLCVKGLDIYSLHSKYFTHFLGALFFFVSDFILLFKYFYIQQIKILKFLNLFSYYSAVMLLALSVI